mmetsp:Transcript_38232/g.119363  ORF Transcript_38232/g.119363 Transcript_38232/m.119363 type:complete len:96 (+) Transcript_38232:985-1272(+)
MPAAEDMLTKTGAEPSSPETTVPAPQQTKTEVLPFTPPSGLISPAMRADPRTAPLIENNNISKRAPTCNQAMPEASTRKSTECGVSGCSETTLLG